MRREGREGGERLGRGRRQGVWAAPGASAVEGGMWVVVSKVHCQLLLQALPFLHWGYFPCNSCGRPQLPPFPPGSRAPSEQEDGASACRPCLSAFIHSFLLPLTHYAWICHRSFAFAGPSAWNIVFYPSGLCFQWHLFQDAFPDHSQLI